MKFPSPTASGLPPHSSAFMEQSQQPCLLPHNTSLPSLHPRQHNLAVKVVRAQQHSFWYIISFLFPNIIFLNCCLKVSSPCGATPGAAEPPFFSHRQLGLCLDAPRTLNGRPPHGQHSVQVCQQSSHIMQNSLY